MYNDMSSTTGVVAYSEGVRFFINRKSLYFWNTSEDKLGFLQNNYTEISEITNIFTSLFPLGVSTSFLFMFFLIKVITLVH